jgi:hypothetical protein
MLDNILRDALLEHTLGLKIANQVGTNISPKCPMKHINDLDFADDMMLISDDS